MERSISSAKERPNRAVGGFIVGTKKEEKRNFRVRFLHTETRKWPSIMGAIGVSAAVERDWITPSWAVTRVPIPVCHLCDFPSTKGEHVVAASVLWDATALAHFGYRTACEWPEGPKAAI